MTDIVGGDLPAEGSSSGPLGGLPRRDLIILPLLSLATLLVLLVFSEIGARLYLPEAVDDACRTHGTAPGSTHGIPNCQSELKLPEGLTVSYTYNECGYRTDAPCGPRPPGAARIAVIGSSMAQGYGVAYDDTFAAQAGRRLTQLCRREVQIENLGAVGNSILGMHSQMDEALSLHPDTVIMVIAPFDVWSLSNFPAFGTAAASTFAPPGAPQAGEPTNLLHRIQVELKSSRALFMAQHLMFKNPSFYVKAYLLYGDKADFLREPFTPTWEQRFAEFERIVGDMADKAHRAGVGFALLLGPQQAQAILMSMRNLPSGVDPHAFGRRMTEIAARHGMFVINTTDAFADVQRPELDFFPVDGHPEEKGNVVMADATVRRLVAGDVAPFAACIGGQSASN